VITVEWGMTGEPLRERIVRMLPSGCELCPPERLPQANAVLVGEGTFGSEELARAECLRLIQLTSLDNPGVDLGAAADRGIPVSGVRLAHHVGVAEHAFLLILALARHLMESDRAVRDRQAYPCKEQVAPGSNFAYNWPHLGGLVDLAGKTLGLVGLGRIGIEVARRARAFEMEVLYWKRTRLPVHLEGRGPALGRARRSGSGRLHGGASSPGSRVAVGPEHGSYSSHRQHVPHSRRGLRRYRQPHSG